MKTNEVFLSVPGYEGYYEISNLGNIKSLRSGKLMKQSKNKDGYKLVSLTIGGKSKCFSVHRLVAFAFIPNPENLPEINHKDENPSNNCADNLEWCDRKYNLNYGGYRERMSKTQKEVAPRKRSVIAYHKDGSYFKTYDSIGEAENELGIGKSCISQCLRGKQKTAGGYIWKYFTEKHLTFEDIKPKKHIDLTTSDDTRFFAERSKWLSENECLDEEMAIEVINF